MTYDDFLNFLEEFEKIPSFAGRIRATDQVLSRIGSGSGRIVYDIDGKYVFKIAKTAKGQAQNNAEVDAAAHPFNDDIIAKVYEYDTTNRGNWLIAEKAKPVTEQRIQELTGIPNLYSLDLYLREFESQQNPQKNKMVFHLSPDKKDAAILDENEFTHRLKQFMADHDQNAMDFGKESSFGEVMRDGKPIIVLIDYGIDSDVYAHHYDPQRKSKYKMYEMVDMNRGQIYQDFSDPLEVRNSMWALQPYSVDDGMDSINEEFINFIEMRENYMIRRPIFNMSTLSEEFHNAVNRLPSYVKSAKNEKKFVKNLINLQEYLTEMGSYRRDGILLEEPKLPALELREEQATKVANFVTQQLGLAPPKLLPDGCGSYGCAYRVGDKVLKVTSDASEVVAAMKAQQAKPKSLAEIYNVWKVVSMKADEFYFVILQEFIENTPTNEFHKITDIYHEIADASDRAIMVKGGDGNLKRRVIDFVYTERYYMRKNFNYEDYIKDMQFLLTAAPELNISAEDRQKVYDFAVGIGNIKRDLKNLGLDKSRDFTNLNNLGYDKDGVLTHFDVGGTMTVQPPDFPDENTMQMDEVKERPMRRLNFVFNEILKIPVDDIKNFKNTPVYVDNKARIDSYMKKNPHDAEFFYGMMDEDGSAKFSTDSAVGQDEFPVYNNIDTSPMTRNDLDANSAMYTEEEELDDPFDVRKILTTIEEDLEYNYVDDATQDEYMLSESIDKETLLKRAEDFSDDYLNCHSFVNLMAMGDMEDIKKHPEVDMKDIQVGDVIAFGDPSQIRHYAIYLGNDELLQVDQWGAKPEISSLRKELAYYEGIVSIHRPPYNELNEGRKKAWVPGSKAVTVKKKCRLAGLGNTSVACNTGDINNLEFSSLSEGEEEEFDIHPDPIVNRFYNKLHKKQQLSRNPFSPAELVYGDNATIKLSRFDMGDRDEIELDNIMAIDKNQGTGTQVMKDITDVADQMGLRMNLHAKPFGRDGLDLFNLINFYKKFGFEPDLTTFDGEFGTEDKYLQYLRKYPDEGMMMFREPNSSRGTMEEEIDPSEAYRDDDALQTLIDGKRNVGILHFAYGDYEDRVKQADLKTIGPIKQDYYGLRNQTHIVYRPEGERDAKELYLIMLKNDGYVPINTPEETRRIGELLGYRKQAIDIFIDRHFDETGQLRPDKERVAVNEEREMISEKDILTLAELPFKLDIERMGGKIYAVGGSVRDSYIGKSSKDLDLVITGVPAPALEKVLAKYGSAKHVGKSFGVYKFVPKGATDEIDIALPRTEVSTGEGHQDFEITADHRIPLEQDLERRDFTMNAIAKDVNGTTIDPFNGLQDISNGIIRVVGKKSFADDPLRMLRAVQFASRFGFTIEPKSYQMLQQNAEKINTISPKRIEEEFEKIVKKGEPLAGAKLLKDSGLLAALVGHDGELFMGPAWNEVNSIAEFIYLLTFNMVKSPFAFAKDKITNEKKILDELEAIEEAMMAEKRTEDPVENRKLANEMYKKSPTSINSKILPRALQRAAQEFNTGRFPKTVKELEIDGNVLAELGYAQKNGMKEVLEEILNEVYAENVRNNREELINLAQSKAGEYLEFYKD